MDSFIPCIVYINTNSISSAGLYINKLMQHARYCYYYIPKPVGRQFGIMCPCLCVYNNPMTVSQ